VFLWDEVEKMLGGKKSFSA